MYRYMGNQLLEQLNLKPKGTCKERETTSTGGDSRSRLSPLMAFIEYSSAKYGDVNVCKTAF